MRILNKHTNLVEKAKEELKEQGFEIKGEEVFIPASLNGKKLELT